MSDYSKTTDFGVKDGLTTGDPNKVVSGTEHDDEYNNIATAIATKSNKKLPATTGNMAGLSASGDLTDSGFFFSGTGGEVTATAAELNTLDGITATTGELNTLDGITATVGELNILDGATVTVDELNELDGVTGDLTIVNSPNSASNVVQLDASALVPTANMPVDMFSGSITGVGASSWSSRRTLTLTNIDTVYGVAVMAKHSTTFTSTITWAVVSDDGYWGGTGTPSLVSVAAGTLDLYLYNPATSTQTLDYRVIVFGTV